MLHLSFVGLSADFISFEMFGVPLLAVLHDHVGDSIYFILILLQYAALFGSIEALKSLLLHFLRLHALIVIYLLGLHAALVF